jgi:hypothetical protein
LAQLLLALSSSILEKDKHEEMVTQGCTEIHQEEVKGEATVYKTREKKNQMKKMILANPCKISDITLTIIIWLI